MILSIIIVNYNTAHFINQTIRSIYRSNIDFNYEIIIVDNKSTDNSVELIKEQFPEIKLIENPSNYGFSKAVNIAAEKSSGNFILLLNKSSNNFFWFNPEGFRIPTLKFDFELK